MKKSELIFSVLLLPVDFVMLVLAGMATYLLRIHILSVFRPVLFEFNLPLEKYLFLIIVASFIFIAAYAVSGLYNMRSTTKLLEEFFKIALASSAGMMVIVFYIFLRQELFDSRFLVIGAWFLAIIFVSVGRLLVRKLQRFMVASHNVGVHKVMVVGQDDNTQKILKAIKANPNFGYRVVRHLTDPEVVEIKSAIGNPGVDEVILANPDYPADRIVELVEFCHENHLVFKFVPNIYQTLTTNVAFDVISGLPLVELKRTALDGWGKVIKRLTDIVGSVLGLLVLSPVLGLVSFAIKWETDGPVFVHLERVSGKRKFRLLKFRSMMKNAEGYKHLLWKLNERTDGPLFKIKDDPRITKVGKFIRHFRLDELPQLWNVFVGEISLVGPRPHQPDEIEKYQKHHRRVLAIKAGVTGMAQVSGSSDLPFEEEVALDVLYMESWSFWWDVKILILTVLKIFRDRSAV